MPSGAPGPGEPNQFSDRELARLVRLKEREHNYSKKASAPEEDPEDAREMDFLVDGDPSLLLLRRPCDQTLSLDEEREQIRRIMGILERVAGLEGMDTLAEDEVSPYAVPSGKRLRGAE